MTWRPQNPEHAIDLVKATIILTEPVPAKLQHVLGSSLQNRVSELGFSQMVPAASHGITIQLGPNGPMALPNAPANNGWSLQRERENGTVTEAFRLSGVELSYMSGEYTRWANFSNRFNAISGETLNKIGDVAYRHITILEVVDRFIYDGAPDQADVSHLLYDISTQVPNEAIKGDTLWHIHRGWFEKISGQNLLVNINIGTEDAHHSDGTFARTLKIFTKIEIRHENGQADFSTLTEDLEILHKTSKAVFSSALLPNARAMIGLED